MLALFAMLLIARIVFLLHAHRLRSAARHGRGRLHRRLHHAAGSSLEETNRVISHVEKILRDTPEVANTSRRTGLQLGLAAVTEANPGDISVKLKPMAPFWSRWFGVSAGRTSARDRRRGDRRSARQDHARPSRCWTSNFRSFCRT